MRRMAGQSLGPGIQIHSSIYAVHPEVFETLTREVDVEKGEKIDPLVKEKARQAMLKPVEIQNRYTPRVTEAPVQRSPLPAGERRRLPGGGTDCVLALQKPPMPARVAMHQVTRLATAGRKT